MMAYRRFKPPGELETQTPATVATLRQRSLSADEVSQMSQLSQGATLVFDREHQPTVAKSQLSQGVNPKWDELDWRVAFDERAAILAFDEGLSRTAAARQARIEIDDQRRRRWH